MKNAERCMETSLLYVGFICFIALVFDFINGFHDSANSIATVVSTRVLKPFHAVLWAGFWNFAAVWFFGFHIAKTVGKGVVPPEFVRPDVILAALLGAIIWDLLTWYVGLPTSSSHALIGGLAGAACFKAGKWVVLQGGLTKIVVFIVLSPLIGLVLAWILSLLIIWLCYRQLPSKVDKIFRGIQIFSSAAYSLGHGTNDAQKTMGIIAAVLFSTVWSHQLEAWKNDVVTIPFWIAIVCNLAMGLGTMAGGWKIVKTMGMKITELKPYGGAAAEAASAVTLFLTAKLGIPVSTTHTITGAIVGVGSIRRLSAVRWGVTRRVLWAWILTIPGAALFAVLSLILIKHPLLTLLGLIVLGALWALFSSRRASALSLQ